MREVVLNKLMRSYNKRAFFNKDTGSLILQVTHMDNLVQLDFRFGSHKRNVNNYIIAPLVFVHCRSLSSIKEKYSDEDVSYNVIRRYVSNFKNYRSVTWRSEYGIYDILINNLDKLAIPINTRVYRIWYSKEAAEIDGFKDIFRYIKSNSSDDIIRMYSLNSTVL